MNYIQKNKQSFGSVARDYKKYRGSYNNALFKYIVSLIKNVPGSVDILDLGCGVGNSTEPLFAQLQKSKKDFSVTGCDPDPEMLAVARKSAKKEKLPITYVQGIAEKIPFPDHSFDLIYSGAAFHWFARVKTLKHIHSKLKKRGVYVVFWAKSPKSNKPVIGQEIYKKFKFHGIPLQWRDPANVGAILKKSGFKKVTIVKVPYVHKRTITQTVGLQKTNSGYAVLSADEKKQFVREMTQAHKVALGNKLNVIRQEIHVCYGTR